MAEDTQGPTDGLTPHITIRDGKGQDAVAFYGAAFGAEELSRHLAEDGRRLMHCHLRINGGSLMLNDDFPEFIGKPTDPPSATTLHLQVANADAAFAKALAAGAEVRFPLADQFWGDRYGQVTDPFGFHWSIGSPLAK